ncbi:MAG: Fe-S cluster assembly ATPase SufC [Mycobacterium leprae]
MTTGAPLRIADLRVKIEEKPILKGLNLTVNPGEIHAIMGPNGAGKTTLGHTLMGHPRYTVTGGTAFIGEQNLLDLPVNERARAGLFLAFQYPFEVSGVTVANFLRQAVNAVQGEEISVWDFQELLAEKMQLLEMNEAFASRYLNEGFSGGEKKRNEMLQMLLLNPKIAVLDETDSGLDVDALKIVSKAVNSLRGPNFGAILITHYHRMLDHIKPDVVHVLMGGRIVKTGGPELAMEIEKKGYDWIKAELGITDEAEVGQGVK